MNNHIYNIITTNNQRAIELTNEHLRDTMSTRGGRIGSGMGLVLETLWCYKMNQAIIESNNVNFELAWFPDHQYNDFAVVTTNSHWDPETGEGEFFRVEAKSMQVGAGVDEPKAHFNVLVRELAQDDAILLLTWEWVSTDNFRVYPQITGCYFDKAVDLAILRDNLHLARGGSFVNETRCPDNCLPRSCRHAGEPLNANGNRERISGPQSCRPRSSSHGANFGGMVRMLKCRGEMQRLETRRLLMQNISFQNYFDFIHTHIPKEERNFYSIEEWRTIARHFNCPENQSIEGIQRYLLQYFGRNEYAPFLPR